jgi:hypothetical protein
VAILNELDIIEHSNGTRDIRNINLKKQCGVALWVHGSDGSARSSEPRILLNRMIIHVNFKVDDEEEPELSQWLKTLKKKERTLSYNIWQALKSYLSRVVANDE